MSHIMQDALGEGYDAHADGTGFFALQSCANHSCEPNAHTLKVSAGCAAVSLGHHQYASGAGGCQERITVQEQGIWLRTFLH